MHNAQQEPSDILELMGWFGSHSRKLLSKNSHKQVHKKLLRFANKASRHRASTKKKAGRSLRGAGKKLSCPNPGSPIFGHVSGGGGSVSYSCNPGYKLEGS